MTNNDFELANKFFNNKQYDNAINIYSNLLDKNYNEIELIPYIINSYIALDDFDSCIKIFKKYLSDSKDSDNDINILNNCLNLLKTLELDDYDFNLNSAKILIQFGKTDEAIKYLNNILENNPEDTVSSKLKAILLYDQNKLEESLSILNNILDKNPNDYLALQYKGYVLLNQKKLKEGIDVFEKVLSIYDKDYNIWRQLYFAYAYSGDLMKSLDVNKNALKIFPDNYILYYDRLELLESINDYNGVSNTLEKLKELKPEFFND
ncbi:hypothetical protein BGI41_05185 [Methanobrevibacter sp. 87.7]|uniref:tetratricopeptide repeat protein n=1 Tax=Methanobrevibacter sp. 87.7 TaxID=387957 RepID=UPI000B50C3F2|nr:tetratricopeptide repeat protein [Methanobrevibacter sp. 87.7]OWT32897.1 hypothetical protein BGI41_05185 [Methanobrevibacter sp. 87.7]